MLTMLHISDLHFGPPLVKRVSESLMANAHDLEPDLIVISGDFTQRARAEQFAAARDYINELPDVPKITIPGNHDIPLYRIHERLLAPRRLYRRYICDTLDQVTEINGVVLVSLDSTSPYRAISNGRIHRDQLEFCTRALAEAPAESIKVVVAHHHFAPAPDYTRNEIMPKAQRAMDQFVELGVDMIMGGHLHRSYIGNSLDFYPGAKRKNGIIIVQCGTSTSRRGRGREKEKNSFNLVHLDEQMFRITHHMYFDEIENFAPISRHIFPRPSRKFMEPQERDARRKQIA